MYGQKSLLDSLLLTMDEERQQQASEDICEFFNRLSSPSPTHLSQEEKVQLVRSTYSSLIDQNRDNDDGVIRSGGGHLLSLSLLFAMIGYLRDKGQTTVAYWMLLIWYRSFPDNAYFLLETFVENQNFRQFPEDLPFGSWRDTTRIAALLRSQQPAFPADHPLLLKLADMEARRADDAAGDDQASAATTPTGSSCRKTAQQETDTSVEVLEDPRYAILRDHIHSSHKHELFNGREL